MTTIPVELRELLERAADALDGRMCIQCDSDICCMADVRDSARELRALLAEQPQDGAGQDVPAGWRVMLCTSSVRRDGDRWEIYSPDGSGGVVSHHDVKDWTVIGLLDALCADPQSAERQCSDEW